MHWILSLRDLGARVLLASALVGSVGVASASAALAQDIAAPATVAEPRGPVVAPPDLSDADSSPVYDDGSFGNFGPFS
jgi:hypothetical protein